MTSSFSLESLESRQCLSAAAYGGLDHAAPSPPGIAVDRLIARPATDVSNSITGTVHDKITSIPYRIFVPQLTSKSQKVPLILFLHDLGSGGTDNISQTNAMSGLQAATASGANAAFILAPQLPSQWVSGVPGNTPQSEGLTLTLLALQQVMKNPNVDTRRIYVTGFSIGGFGVWDALRRHPNLFAAGVPISYGGDPATARLIARIPIWAFHGSADTTQPASASEAMITALIAAGGTPWYTEFPGAGHEIFDRVYNMPSLYTWMFAQRRSRPGKT